MVMSIVNGMKCICPACFEEIYLGECAIMSGITSGKELKPASKGRFARMRRVEPLTGPEYAVEKAQRKCTECGYLLPYNIEDVPTVILSIVGDITSGKSHYIAAFIHQLREWLGNNELAQLECLTPKAEQKYMQDIFEPLIFDKQAILGNQPTIVPQVIPNQPPPPRLQLEPLIYRLTVRHSQRHTEKTINLMIYDSAGEAYEDTDRLVQVARFVLHTTALIFVVDPYKITASFSHIPSATSGTRRGRRVVDSITAITSIFQRYRGSANGANLSNVPVAVMLSKADLFKTVFPISDYTFMENPAYMTMDDYDGTLDLDDIDTVDQEVRAILRSYRQQDIVSAVNVFRRKKFFATSATGSPPDLSGHFPDVSPCRCLDPVLWILHEVGVIKAR